MRKAVLKRIKITKTGKLLHRHPGQNHFNAKEKSRMQSRKGGFHHFYKATARQFKAHINQ